MGTVYKIKFSDDVIFNNYDSGKLRELSFLKSRIYNTIGSIIKDLKNRNILYTDRWIVDIREYALEKISTFSKMQELVDFITAMRFICIDQYESYYDQPATIDVVLPNDEWEIGYDILKLTFWNTAINLILEKSSLHKVCLVQHCSYKLERVSRSYIGKPYESLHIFDWQDVKKSEKYKKRFSKKKTSTKENKKEE